MNRSATILAAILGGSLIMSVWASRAGWGAPQPEKQPPSLREESARQGALGRGHHRTRYFMGGGFIGGK